MIASPTPTPTRSAATSNAARHRLLSVPGEPLFLADWHQVLMLHFQVDPRRLQTSVPFTLDLHHGRAFVTLVAFTLRDLRPRFGGTIGAWLFRPIATHEFLNVRTYVKVNGEAGIHFLAEWLTNPLAVRLGPRTFALPYRLGRIHYQHGWRCGTVAGSVTDATSGNRFAYRAMVPAQPQFAVCPTHTLDHWLMERYSAFNSAGSRRRLFRVWHSPWLQCPLHASVTDRSLLTTHWTWMENARLVGSNFSPGVGHVWMGRPHAVTGPPTAQLSGTI